MADFRFWLAHDSYMDNALNFDCKEIVERSAVQKLTSVITKSLTLLTWLIAFVIAKLAQMHRNKYLLVSYYY